MAGLSLTSQTTQIIDNELSQRDCNDNNDHYHSLIITKVFAPFVWLSLENPAKLLCRKNTVLISTLVESQQKWLWGMWGSGFNIMAEDQVSVHHQLRYNFDLATMERWNGEHLWRREITQLSHSLHTPYAQEWLMDLKLKYFPL